MHLNHLPHHYNSVYSLYCRKVRGCMFIKLFFFFFKCCTLCFNLQAVRLIKWEWFCFKISWIGFFTTSLQPQGVVGTHCFHTQSILFYKCPPAVHTPTSGCRGKEKKCFSYFRGQTKIFPIMSVMHQIPGVASSFVPPQKLQGDTVNIFSLRPG